MTREEATESLNDLYFSQRDNRVQKPDIWLNESESRDYLLWPTNWTLTFNETHLRFDKPNDIAIYSKIAMENLTLSKEFYDKTISNLIVRVTVNSVQLKHQKLYFDYFEKIIASIVFSYSALEAFANIFIPEDYTETQVGKDNVVKIHNKSDIEKKYSLRDKFKIILKKVLQTNDPSNEKWWSSFILLENTRNEIIHSKPSKSEERYSLFLNPKIFQVIASHQDVIRFYGKYIASHKDKYLINSFPYGFGYDSAMHCIVEADEMNEIKREIGNVKF